MVVEVGLLGPLAWTILRRHPVDLDELVRTVLDV
jgi:hypothetical protein